MDDNELSDDLDWSVGLEIAPSPRPLSKSLPPATAMIADATIVAEQARKLRPSSGLKTPDSKQAAPQQDSNNNSRLNTEENRISPPRLDGSHPNLPNIVRLLRDCENWASRLRSAGTRREHILIECLQRAARLEEYGRTQDPEGFNQLLAERKIKITKRTNNPFTPVIKLIFQAFDKNERTSLSRYASILRYAHDNEIRPDEFGFLLKQEGGIAECVRQDQQEHPSPERAAAARKCRDHLHTLRATPPSPDFTDLGTALPAGLSAILVEADERGGVRLLGIKKETTSNVRRYMPLPDNR